jgi:hypothetical protein
VEPESIWTLEKTTASVGNRTTVVHPELVITVNKIFIYRRLKWVGKIDFVLN